MFLRPAGPKHGAVLDLDIALHTTLPPVHILYAYVDMSPDLVQAALDMGVQGLVLAGVGNGNASRALVERLARAVTDGVPVVRSTRTGSP